MWELLLTTRETQKSEKCQELVANLDMQDPGQSMGLGSHSNRMSGDLEEGAKQPKWSWTLHSEGDVPIGKGDLVEVVCSTVRLTRRHLANLRASSNRRRVLY